jgi:hypothetical protein
MIGHDAFSAPSTLMGTQTALGMVTAHLYI